MITEHPIELKEATLASNQLWARFTYRNAHEITVPLDSMKPEDVERAKAKALPILLKMVGQA